MSLDEYVKGVNTFLFTQVHCVRDNRILLMKRNKEPNYGLWVAPGGKIEKHESPHECAIRELREETGLCAQAIQLRGIVSVVSPKIEQPCMQFLYLVTAFSGELVPDEREGIFHWWSMDEVQSLPLPPANAVFLPRVLDKNWVFYEAKYVYSADWRLIEVVEHTTQMQSHHMRECLEVTE